MNYIALSDIHFQLIESSIYKEEWFSKTIEKYINYWMNIQNEKDKNITLIFAGDFWNFVVYTVYKKKDKQQSFEKLKRKNLIVSLELYLNLIKQIIENKWYYINNILYIKGNHEYYNDFPKKEFNFIKNSNIVDILLQESFQKTYWISWSSLEENPNIIWNTGIIWNILYTSWDNLESYKYLNFSVPLQGTSVFKKLNDANQISLIFEKEIKYYFKDETIENIIWIKEWNFDSKDINLIYDNFSILIWEMKNNLDDVFKNHFGKMAYFIFSFNFLKLIKDINFLKDKNISQLIIVTHFPFNWESWKIIYSFENIQVDEFNQNIDEDEKSQDKTFDCYYKVNEDFLKILIDYIYMQFGNKLTNITFISGHTHFPKKMFWLFSEYNYIINFINNSIWYVDDFKKQYLKRTN